MSRRRCLGLLRSRQCCATGALDGGLVRCPNILRGRSNGLGRGGSVLSQTSARTELIWRSGVFLTGVDSLVDETNWLMVKVMSMQLCVNDEAMSPTFRGRMWRPFLLCEVWKGRILVLILVTPDELL